MNRPIRRVSLVAALMVLALLVNVSYAVIFRYPGLDSNVQNRRVRDADFARARGAILVGNAAIAQSVAQPGSTFAYKRSYSQAELYAAVTGFYAYDFGSAGIELNHNKVLAGTDDSQAISRVLAMLTGKQQQGASVQTTINAKAQQAAYDGLAGRKGAVVALNYETGAVLSYVSLPTYDPNTLSTTDLAAARKSWQTLNADKNRPLANRASKEIYPPGSTFKLVTAAAALESGLNPDSMIDAPDSMTLPQTTTNLGNEIDCGNGKTTLVHALEISCNTAFAKLGLSLGSGALRTQAEKFGFDQNFDTDVPLSASKFPAELNQPQTALSAIGQYDVAASPLQMAMVVAGIANNGTVMQPYLVSEVRGANLQVLSAHPPTKLSQAMSSANAAKLRQMMVSVVQNGTGTNAQISGVEVGGKTGTAQSDPTRKPYAWFVAYSADPKVAVAVFIEDADIDRNDIAGGRLAAPIAKRVIEALR